MAVTVSTSAPNRKLFFIFRPPKRREPQIVPSQKSEKGADPKIDALFPCQ